MLGLEAATRTRYAAGSWGSDGRWDDGASSSLAIRVSFQPASAQVLATLPEGERTRDPRMVWISRSTPLRPLSQHDGWSADRITVGSVTYEVRDVSDFGAASPLPHIQALVVRYQEPDATAPDGKLEDLLQAMREAVKVALVLDDDEVIVYTAEGGGPRPALPYYAVRVVGDVPEGTDWLLQTTSGGGTTVLAEGNRTATVSIFGYGASTGAGLEGIASAMRLPNVLAELGDFAVDPDGAIVAAPQMLDTGIEHRFQRDFTARYIQRSVTADQVVAELVEISIDVTTPVGTSPVNIAVSVDAS